MFDSLLSFAALQVESHLAVAALCAFAWGLVCVVFSPCHLAAIPVMAAHAAGYTSAENHSTDTARIGTVTSLGFALGYFLAITALGIVCALLGRVVDLVDEHFWMLPAGVMLLWLGISLWREHDCSGTGRLLQGLGRRLGLSAVGGSVALGAGYGLLSSGCTLAFLAPVLLLSLPQGIWAGTVMATAFGLGHCLPMALVGMATPLARRLILACRMKGLVVPRYLRSPAHNATHTQDAPDTDNAQVEAAHPHKHEHHAMELGFRKVVAVTVCLGGLTLLFHAFWE